MQPARFRQEDILLVEINNAKSMSPAVSSGRSAGSFPEQRLVIEPNVGVEKIKLSRLLVQRINEFKMTEIQRKTPQQPRPS